MSSRPRRRVSLPSGKKFHFNVIYNNAKSKLSKTSDTELSLKVTEHFIEIAKEWGYDQAYYTDRDALPGQNVFTELFEVIDSSMYTIVILTNGFLSNCWARYCQLSAFKSLLDKEGTDPESATSKLIPVLIGISDKQLLRSLNLNKYVSFTHTDWKTDKKEWGKARQMMKDRTLIPGEVNNCHDIHQPSTRPIQETETPGTVTRVALPEDTPSLSQFNRPETDGPSSSNASETTTTHDAGTQRERTQRKEVTRSDGRNNPQAAVAGKSDGRNNPQAAVAERSDGRNNRQAAEGRLSASGRASANSHQTEVTRKITPQPSSSLSVQNSSTKKIKSEKKDGERSQPTPTGGASSIDRASNVGKTAIVSRPSHIGKTTSEGGVSNVGKTAAVGGASNVGKTAAVGGASNVVAASNVGGASNIKTTGSKEPIPTQEQDLLRREIISAQVSIQAEQSSTSYSSLPAQQFISSPSSPLGPSITMPAEAAKKVSTGQPLETEAAHLESRNLSNDMPTIGNPQSKRSKVIPPGDISGNLRQNSSCSSEETHLKQFANKVATVPIKSTMSPTSDSGIGSVDTTPSQSLDPYSAMQYQFPESLSSPQEEISEEPLTNTRRETTFTSKLASPPVTQICSSNVTQDISETFKVPSNNVSKPSSSSSAGMSKTGDTQKSDGNFDSIGSMQNQSDLDLDHGSFPSGDARPAVTESKSQKDETESLTRDQSESVRGANSILSAGEKHEESLVCPVNYEGDLAEDSFIKTGGKQPEDGPDQQKDETESLTRDQSESARGANSVLSAGETILERTHEDDGESFVMDSGHNASNLSLSSSTCPIEEKEEEQLISDKEESISQEFTESGKSDGENPAVDTLMKTGGKQPEEGSDPQKDEKFDALSAPLASNLTNGKVRTRRASMSDLARPAMNFLGNWIWKPALHVINGADQLYI